MFAVPACGVDQQVEQQVVAVAGVRGGVQPALRVRLPVRLRQLGEHLLPAAGRTVLYVALVHQRARRASRVRQRHRVADPQEETGVGGRGRRLPGEAVEHAAPEPAARRHQLAQGVQCGCGAALTAGEVVQPDQRLVGMGRRDHIGAHAEQNVGEISRQLPVPAPHVDQMPETPAVPLVLEPGGECVDSCGGTGQGRGVGAPSVRHGRQLLPLPGTQVLVGEPFHQVFAEARSEVGIVQLRTAGGPDAEETSEVGHVVPEVGADSGVEVQLVEPHVTVRSGRRGDLRQALGQVLAFERGNLVFRDPESAEQQGSGVVDDVGMPAVQHGRGEQQCPLRHLASFGDEAGDLLSPGLPRIAGLLAPAGETVAGRMRRTSPPHPVGEVRDFFVRTLLGQEIGPCGRGLQVLLVRYPVKPEVTPEHLLSRRAVEIGPAELEVGFQRAAVRHDDHQVRLLLLDGLAERRQISAIPPPSGAIGLGKVQQQPVPAPDQPGIREWGFLLVTGQQFTEDAGVPVKFVQEDACCGGSAAARRSVQDHGAVL